MGAILEFLNLRKNKADKTDKTKFYAIKHVKKKHILDTGAPLEIMKREISIQSRLVHPNIVSLYNVEEDDQNFYLILEYLSNGSLFSYIRKKGHLTEDEAFHYFIQISNSKMISDIFNVPVYISKFDLELFDNQNAREVYTDGFMNKLKLNKMIKDNDNKISDKPNNIIDIVNGDTFSKLNFDNVKVISLPGHTRGSIGVLVNKKDLIVGDTLVNDKDINDSNLRIAPSFPSIKELEIATKVIFNAESFIFFIFSQSAIFSTSGLDTNFLY